MNTAIGSFNNVWCCYNELHDDVYVDLIYNHLTDKLTVFLSDSRTPCNWEYVIKECEHIIKDLWSDYCEVRGVIIMNNLLENSTPIGSLAYYSRLIERNALHATENYVKDLVECLSLKYKGQQIVSFTTQNDADFYDYDTKVKFLISICKDLDDMIETLDNKMDKLCQERETD